MPGQEQQTAAVGDRETPEVNRTPDGERPAEGDWEAYSVDVLNDLLDS